MLYLLATLALILKVNADSMEDSMEPCVQCCQIDPGHVTIHHDLAEGEEPPVLDFPHILFTDEMWDHTDALVEHLDSLLDDAEENILMAPEALEGAPEAAEYWIQKTAEMWALHGEGVQRIIHVDGTVGHIEPWPLPVGSKWIVGKLDLEEDMASEDMTSAEIDDQIIWSNVAAECIEKDGEYIWSTSVGDVYVALFERDNAECAYVNGEDVNGCDAPIAPPVAPATTDPIEIDAPQPTDTSLPVDDLGDDNTGVDTNADIDNNQVVQQLQDASASPEASRQSVPTWVIPTAVGGVLVLTLSYIMYIYKRKLVPSALPDIEAPRDAAPQDIEIHVEEPSDIDVEAPSDIESQDVQTVTQEVLEA